MDLNIAMQSGATASPSGEQRRRRAKHSKTRLGCSRCKQRHIKCDETRPACLRCVQTGLTCPGFEEPQSSQRRVSIKRFRIIQCATDTDSDTSSSSRQQAPRQIRPRSTPSTADSAVDFFLSHTLSHLSKFLPCSRLWQESSFTDLLSDAKIRNIIVAIGLCHQAKYAALEWSNHPRPVDCDDLLVTPREEWDEYYNKSLAYSRADLIPQSQGGVQDRLAIAITCLLFVVYLSIQGRGDEGIIHMNSGLSIINEEGKGFLAASELHQEVYLFFLNIGACSWPCHPNLQLFRLLRATSSLRCHLGPLPPLQSMSAKMDFYAIKLYEFASKISKGNLGSAQDVAAYRDHMLQDADALGQELDSYAVPLHVPSPDHGVPHIDPMFIYILRSRVILFKIFSSCVITRYQTTYDKHHKSFTQALDFLERALMRGREHSGPEWFLFSLHFAVIVCLRHIIMLCRHPVTRRKALTLLDLCPQHEGILDVQDARLLGDIIIKFEEAGLDTDMDDNSCTLIPEENRIHLIERIPPEVMDSDELTVRVLYRPDGDCGYVEKRFQVQKPSGWPATQLKSM